MKNKDIFKNGKVDTSILFIGDMIEFDLQSYYLPDGFTKMDKKKNSHIKGCGSITRIDNITENSDKAFFVILCIDPETGKTYNIEVTEDREIEIFLHKKAYLHFNVSE